MKLLKKLAAVALAAVLALSMVGCGNASGVNYTKQFMLNMMADSVAMYGGECHNTPDMDGIAQKLLTEANAAYHQDETQTNKAVKALLNVAVEKMRKEGDLNAGTGYGIEFVEDYQFRSSFIPDAEKQAALIRNMEYISVNGGIDDDDEADELDIGVAVGKIGDKTYVVMVMMPTESTAAPGTTKD